MALSFSPKESARFGFKIFRLETPSSVELAAIFEECVREGADIVILRMGAEEGMSFYPEISKACHTIAADSLIEFRKVLKDTTVADFLDSGASIREMRNDEAPQLKELVSRCYSEYRNHYFENPSLNPETVLDGLTEFSQGFLSTDNRTVLVATHAGIACGYLCMEIRDGCGSSVIGGSALDIPQALRHKILCDLTHHGDRWLMERHVKRFKAVTRLEKTYIQKLLIHNMHCLPARSLVTMHLNLFLHKMKDSISAEATTSQNMRLHSGTYYVLRHSQPVSSHARNSWQFERQGMRYIYSCRSDVNGMITLESQIFG